MFALVGVAAMAMSVGFLAPGFDLIVQQLGAEETLLEAPINTAYVDFSIGKIETTNGKTGAALHTVFRNVIEACSFETPTELGDGSVVICKLTDQEPAIVAEGKLLLPNGLPASTETMIPINQVAFLNANDVQNIEDVKIIVLGEDPTDVNPVGN